MSRVRGACKTAISAALWLLLGVAPIAAVAQEVGAVGELGTARARYADRTMRFASEDRGGGIIYSDDRGRAFLWVPGQIKIVRGFRYLDPILLERPSGPVWSQVVFCLEFFGDRSGTSGIARFKAKDCLPADRFDEMVVERREGDLFNLATGSVPCRLCDPAMTIERLGGT